MAKFVKVAHVDEIPLRRMKSFEIDLVNVVVCHTEEGFFALEDKCSHDFAPISTGRIDRKGQIVCPRHGARFECKTGNVTHPPAIVGIDTYAIKIENDEIYISID